jgi:lipid-A-disaccharide synthase
MYPRSVMIIAGEASGDAVAADLVKALRNSPAISAMPFPPQFFGAGGPQMAAAGVDLAFDLTQHSVFGISDVLRHYFKFKALFDQLFQLALDREPDVIILVDYAGFNRRFAKAIKDYVRARTRTFHNWNPKIVYYVSPQVWASRESRVYQLARDVDLLLSIFPFEKEWYASRVPGLRIEFVGHPLIDRHAKVQREVRTTESSVSDHASRLTPHASPSPALLLLLPGSRRREIDTHLPLMAEALEKIRRQRNVRARLILPNSELVGIARNSIQPIADLEIWTSGLAESLAQADLAIASSGTVTLECAYFAVPTVVLYKTSWLTYQIARRIIKVKFIAMPNILAGERIYPEFIQSQATPDRIADEALAMLNDPSRRETIRSKLIPVIASLGSPGASARAADAVLRLFA